MLTEVLDCLRSQKTKAALQILERTARYANKLLAPVAFCNGTIVTFGV